jgi:hypothetical protein
VPLQADAGVQHDRHEEAGLGRAVDESACAAGLIAMSADQYHTLTVTPFGRDVMGRVEDVQMLVPAAARRTVARTAPNSPVAAITTTVAWGNWGDVSRRNVAGSAIGGPAEYVESATITPGPSSRSFLRRL